jgi:cytochrome c oxidase assembly protein subunit 15
MVTSKNVGLAVPDWPTTFGYNMFLFPVSKWVGGILFEHTHRLMGSLVGFLTIVLAAWLWLREDRRWVRNLGLIALGGVILQGILGGLRVTMMKDEIGIFHACVAQAFLGLVVFIGLVTTDFWRLLPASVAVSTKRFPASEGNLRALSGQVWQRLAPLKMFAFAITITIYVQLALGATMRHQHRDLSILDFPTANRAWIPDTSAAALAKINAWRDARGFSEVDAFQIWLQMAHRFVALIISIAVIAFCFRVRRDPRGILPDVELKAAQQRAHSKTQARNSAEHVGDVLECGGVPPLSCVAVRRLRTLSMLWLVLVFCQIALGAWTIWSNKAADVATAHVALGAVMLSFGVSISAICWRISQAEISRARPPGAPQIEPIRA